MTSYNKDHQQFFFFPIGKCFFLTLPSFMQITHLQELLQRYVKDPGLEDLARGAAFAPAKSLADTCPGAHVRSKGLAKTPTRKVEGARIEVQNTEF